MTYVYEPIVSSQIYGLHIPYDKGYDAHSQRNYPSAEKHNPSGYFRRADGATIALWVTEMTADFTLSGQTGQSRMQREFYPRSFNDVTLRIQGNVASTQEYNRLALFVREHQWRALNYINQGGTGVDQTITFGLYDNTPSIIKNGRRAIKGHHQPWQIQGYISTIAAGAVAHNVAPAFSIDYVVCDTASNGNMAIWSEILEAPSALSSFIGFVNRDITNQQIFGGFVPTPTVPKPASQSNRSVGKAVKQGVKNQNKNWVTTIVASDFGF